MRVNWNDNKADSLFVNRHLGKGMTAKVKIQLSNRAIPLETFKQNKQLGRIMLRRGGETIAAGVVDEASLNSHSLG